MAADALKIPVNINVKKADHLQPLAFQVGRALRVMAAAGLCDMAVAVKLDNQPGLGTVEINDLIADGALPPEAKRIGAQEVKPEMAFLRRHGLAESISLIVKIGIKSPA